MSGKRALTWKHPVTLSLAYRFVINAASPSHELVTGEYTEHKKADIYWGGRLYTNVPIISGNAVRRYVKEALRDIAVSKGLPLGGLCRRGIFTHWNTSRDMKEDVGTSDDFLEGLRKCVMEDVSGFMLAEGNRSVIRFSRLHVSMVKPVYEDLENASVYHIQFARHDVRRGAKGEAGEKLSGQQPFRVEHVSGRFAGVITLDAHLIGYDDIGYGGSEPKGYFISKKKVIERAEAVVKAISDGVYRRFGSMKARSLTVIAQDTAVLAVVKGVYTPPDPSLEGSSEKYVELVKKDLKAYTDLMGVDAHLIVVGGGCAGGSEGRVNISCFDTVPDAFQKAAEVVREYLKSAIPDEE